MAFITSHIYDMSSIELISAIHGRHVFHDISCMHITCHQTNSFHPSMAVMSFITYIWHVINPTHFSHPFHSCLSWLPWMAEMSWTVDMYVMWWDMTAMDGGMEWMVFHHITYIWHVIHPTHFCHPWQSCLITSHRCTMSTIQLISAIHGSHERHECSGWLKWVGLMTCHIYVMW